MEISKPQKTLVVLAAGLGSRYQGLKQIDKMVNGSSILEFSVYDALKTGFNKFVFIINPLFPESYLKKLSQILEQQNVEFHFVNQDKSFGVNQTKLLQNRTKPWGTGHAVLCASGVVQENFLVINADDFYGRSAYETASENLELVINSTRYGMVAYLLENTLSKNGSVSRGICKINKDHYLKDVEEITNVYFNKDIYYFKNQEKINLNPKLPISMNFWLFNPSIFTHLKRLFHLFLDNNPDPNKEFFLPSAINQLIKNKDIDVKANITSELWKGITYPEDKVELQNFLQEKISKNCYPNPLWNS